MTTSETGGEPGTGEVDRDCFVHHGTDVEMRWDGVDSTQFCTPTEAFFVRNHTSTPVVDPATYRLSVYGDGLRAAPTSEQAIRFSLDELRAMPARTITSALECTGNGRRFFGSQQASPAPGTDWALGAIGVATWGGVPLAEVLHRAGVVAEAIEVMAVGLDEPYVHERVDHGRVRRPIPVAKALDDVLVVLEMNGEPLPPDHGFPARLLVPGWVGVASIKWLGELEVSTQPMTSPWNTVFYRLRGEEYGAEGAALDVLPVKSAFELSWNATLRAGSVTVLRGRSWSGAAAIESVEVSLDGGDSWVSPTLFGPNERHGWARWELAWTPPAPGHYELLARATDRSGRRQPDTVPFNADGYLFWAVVRHPVTVRA